MRILVVEDDYLLAIALEAALVDVGHEVVGVAQSAQQAVCLAIENKPDLAVMDIRLLGSRDGVDAAIEIYQRSGMRCLFATAHDDPETKSRAAEAAPLGWLPKPYTTAALHSALGQAITNLHAST
jgi:DNA-binding NarL/FixJ family response regulator